MGREREGQSGKGEGGTEGGREGALQAQLNTNYWCGMSVGQGLTEQLLLDSTCTQPDPSRCTQHPDELPSTCISLSMALNS